jgi:hypothetical protein
MRRSFQNAAAIVALAMIFASAPVFGGNKNRRCNR